MRIPKRDIEFTYLDWRALKLASLVILVALVAFFITQTVKGYLLPASNTFPSPRELDAIGIGFLLVCIPSFVGLSIFIVAVCIFQLGARYLQPGVETRWAVMGGLYGFLIPIGNMLIPVLIDLPLNSGVQSIIGGLLIMAWLMSPFLLVFKLLPVPDYEIQPHASAELGHEEN